MTHEQQAVSVADIEQAARAIMSERALAYITGAAADEITLGENERAYRDIRLTQRVLIDVSSLDTSLQLWGVDLPHPILIAPTAAHRLVNADAEVATVRGAVDSDALMVVSTLATRTIESIREAAGPGHPLGFQTYVQRDRGLTRELLARAEAAGCCVIMVTVDTPVVGVRNREERIGFRFTDDLHPVHLSGASVSHWSRDADDGIGAIYAPFLDASMTWSDIEWVRSATSLPVVVKGLTARVDASIARREGVDGVIVSNHGARNLDTATATIDALPAVAEEIGGVCPVLVDGGIRRGTDVLKALACGADAVMIGRPCLYGLAMDGSAGVARVINILRREFLMSMALTGCRSLSEINPSVLWQERPTGRRE